MFEYLESLFAFVFDGIRMDVNLWSTNKKSMPNIPNCSLILAYFLSLLFSLLDRKKKLIYMFILMGIGIIVESDKKMPVKMSVWLWKVDLYANKFPHNLLYVHVHEVNGWKSLLNWPCSSIFKLNYESSENQNIPFSGIFIGSIHL